MAQFPRFDNAKGVWKLSEVYEQVYNGTWPNNGAIGVFGGGAVFPGTNTFNIESVNLTSQGSTTVFGNLSVAGS